MEQKLIKRYSKGVVTYNLIEDGDHILIGLSGGKDSLALVMLLGRQAKIHKPCIKVEALHVVMKNIPYQSDIEYLKGFCQDNGIILHVRETSFDESTDTRKSHCFLCSWNRRKMLFEAAKELGCNKIALGHHMDDILETTLLNMTFQGNFDTMPPKMVMRKFPMTIIRPLCLVHEDDLIELAETEGFKKQNKNCPYEKESNRTSMRHILKEMEKLNPEARYSLWGSMKNILER